MTEAEEPEVIKVKGLRSKGFINFRWGLEDELFLGFQPPQGNKKKTNNACVVVKWNQMTSEYVKLVNEMHVGFMRLQQRKRESTAAEFRTQLLIMSTNYRALWLSLFASLQQDSSPI
eukprot:TRINITY_DN2753_c0_g1_i3.p1 TRINITY_DN2753_c0_g1~~TRINITY_DN2753_c0_g1_i3.p1  ORF type:complete len:117 (+),score=37.07 TRINITY_DN2753_c0_g1_i3:57-407(+)